MAFQKGQSGNPGGRPKIPDEIKEKLPKWGEEGLEFVREKMLDEDASDRIRVQCAQILIERAYGKPTQQIEGDIDSILQIVMDEEMRELMG